MNLPSAQERGRIRNQELRRYFDESVQRALEFGPLASPVLVDAARVRYVDHCDTETLRAKHGAGNSEFIDKIVPVDIIWAGGPVGTAFDGWRPVDLILASHVVEHVPDLVRWLQALEEILRPGGVVSLAVPDRRRTFDYLRRESTIGDVLECHYIGATRPSLRAVIDHRRYAVRRNGLNSWNDETRLEDIQLAFPDARVWRSFVDRWRSGEYIDTHCWV